MPGSQAPEPQARRPQTSQPRTIQLEVIRSYQITLNMLRVTLGGEGNPSVWCACEFTTMRHLRRYFRKEREVDAKLGYISSYWKHGLSEEQHKIVKREDEVIAKVF